MCTAFNPAEAVEIFRIETYAQQNVPFTLQLSLNLLLSIAQFCNHQVQWYYHITMIVFNLHRNWELKSIWPVV